MTKLEKRQIIDACLSPKKLARVYMNYTQNYWYYFFPMESSDTLFLGIEEDDFILDGYSIRRLRDIDKIEIKDDICLEIHRKQGTLEAIVAPDVDITNWETVFTDLKRIGKNIIVERELPDNQDADFWIGRIERVNRTSVLLRCFDGDGIWGDAPVRISYPEITSVTANSRYGSVFSKYLDPLPDNFKG